MKIREIVDALEEFAPLSLQDGYDNAGLQIGLTDDADATGALLCLDVTEEVVDEAFRKGCNVIVSHHPLLFRPCKTLVGADYVQRCAMSAIRKGIAIYSAHTNLDNARGGVSWEMAGKLGLGGVKTLEPREGDNGAGAGVIGTLAGPMPADDFMRKVKAAFGVACVRRNKWTGRTVSRVALCGGAGAFLADRALAAGADAFITGEIGYHRFFGYEDTLLLMEIGHFESERHTVALLRRLLADKLPSLRLELTETDTNPICYLTD